MELKNKKILVIGAGRSGLAVTAFLAGKGARVTLTDIKGADKLGDTGEGLPRGAELCLGNYPRVTGGSFDLLVVSPGVPLTVEPVAAARDLGIPVMGELELAFQFSKAPFVAITGTNGKTTTTSLVGEIFRDAGFKTLVAGNIGLPLVTGVEQYIPEDIVVAEVSSFQLETTAGFRPRVGVILNITPDHLDRHGSMTAYIAAKARVFVNQDQGDYTVLNYDDPETRALEGLSPGKVIFFSRRHILEEGVFVQDGNITAAINGKIIPVLPAAELQIPGAHNLENALAAVACALVLGVAPESLANTLRKFSGVAHRLEPVTEINGVKYVNDSKGTNPDASIKALEAFDQPIVLIAGGKNKGNDFAVFASKVRERARVLVVLGQCAAELEAAAKKAGCTTVLRAGAFPEAVELARQAARPGEIVLLSPACASWDMFNSYEERGDLFKELVRQWAEQENCLLGKA